MTNTPTPRTDAVEFEAIPVYANSGESTWSKKKVISSDYARQLERELIELQERHLIETSGETCSQCKHSMSPSLIESGWCIFCILKERKQEHDEAQRKAKALDWVIKYAECCYNDDVLDDWIITTESGYSGLLDAIEAAMNKQ
jgi:hypothetical protein